jgi:hypothetical protein
MGNKSKSARKAAKAGTSTKIKRVVVSAAERELAQLKVSLLAPAQAANGRFEACDVVNHTAAEHREMVRALGANNLNEDARRTLRKLTRVELLVRDKTIPLEHQPACEWYGVQYELAFQFGQGTCANYGGVGGSGGLGWDHGSRTLAQMEARENLAYAREAIPGWLLHDFERVVIGPMDIRTLTKEGRLRFSLAAFLLHGQIGHLLLVAA